MRGLLIHEKGLKFLNITSYFIMIFCSVATKHTMKDEPQKSTKSSVSSKERYLEKQKGIHKFLLFNEFIFEINFFFFNG